VEKKMAGHEVTLIALDIKKWDLDSQRLGILNYFVLDNEERNHSFELSITQPPEMVEEFLGKIRYTCSEKIQSSDSGEEINFTVVNETFLRQKLYNYFKKVLLELNNPKRKRGEPKFIYSTHMDVYTENQDISFLPQFLQFFVVLNWARKYYEQEDYQKAIDPLRQLIQIKPDYGLAYKWLARSLKKTRKYEDAMHYYQKYAEVDNSLDSWLDLAKSYRKGKIFDKSEQIYLDILEKYPEEKEVKIGLAQIYYARNESIFLEKLKELFDEDPVWLKNWLSQEFNFRIYTAPKTPLTPVDASRYLGFSQVFELTQKAFKNEVPSHFNPAKARMNFYKEELDNWSLVVNEFNLLGQKIELHPEKININALKTLNDLDEIEAEAEKKVEPKPVKRSTKVEEIIRKIREAKAQRAKLTGNLGENSEIKSSQSPEVKSPKGKSNIQKKQTKKKTIPQNEAVKSPTVKE
jgi:tetratricopeptide (TPR) repeat protein